jgi:hypothetical protein
LVLAVLAQFIQDQILPQHQVEATPYLVRLPQQVAGAVEAQDQTEMV